MLATALACLTFLPACSIPVRADEVTARVDAIFAPWDDLDSPGAAVMVIQGGDVAYSRGYGLANLEHSIAISPRSVFYLGSVSKQFVAFCVALLEQDGKLAATDDVRKFIPELPDYGDTIAVGHLVHHTSGLRDYLGLMDLAGLPLGHFRDDQGIVDLLARQQGLNFAPGERYMYSNSGYLLLAVIVERVAKKSLKEFARERIFKPLGMEHTHFHDDYMHLIKRRASGYFPGPGGEFRNFISTFDRVGSGGVYSSVEDLALWDRNFYAPIAGDDAVLERIHTPGVLDDGTQIDYAWGLRVSTYRGLNIVDHSGALGGYRSAFLRFPDQELSVIVLANLSSMSPADLARRVAEVYLGDRMSEPVEAGSPRDEGGKPARANAKLSLSSMRDYEGDYWSAELEVTYRLSMKGSALGARIVERRADRDPLPPGAPDVFESGSTRVEFERTDEEITGFVLGTGRVKGIVFEKR